jgi:maltose alpha-D-glucosyltransferase / alpha-amylase
MPSDPLWYKDAIIYQVHVKSFFDSNGDGMGDFQGLIDKLDYIQELGATCIWLLPFYPSPLKDDGYDVSDYESVHPAYGTLKDCERFIEAAHARDLTVLVELIVNHTSDQHPWFQAARRAPKGSPERDFYVWSDTDQKFPETRIIFTDSEKSNWTYDPVAGQYYWHRFFSHQPDLNHNNPAVVEAMIGVMRFWLARGVDALRLDAVPYLCVREGTTNENLPETHAVLKRMRKVLDTEFEHRALVAEANQWPSDVREFFGDGDECHMGFHFPLMPRMFMAIRLEERHPITEILRQTPDIPETCQWAIFLRNHDELTLEMVTDEERDYMYRTYAAEPQMRINVGIRRRLAPLLENSRREIELLNSLLFSMPGTPIAYYGDELGMGDNIYLGDRNGVRTPMQWTGDRNAGFSRADPARLYAPLIMDPVYTYQSINVEAQQRYPLSLLNFMKRISALRKQHRVFGRGTIEFLSPENRKVLAYVRRYENEKVLCVANLSRSVQPVELDLSEFKGLTPIEMFERTEFPRIGESAYFFTLSPHGFLWFELQEKPSPVAVRVAPPATVTEAEAAVPLLFAGPAWGSLLDSSVRRFLERDALVPFLKRQRWFGGKARTIRSVRFADWAPIRDGVHPAYFTTVDVDYDGGLPERYTLPLAIAETAHTEGGAEHHPPGSVIARLTGARKGVIIDALHDEDVARRLLAGIERGTEWKARLGRFEGQHRGTLPLSDPAMRISGTSADQSNSAIVFGDKHIFKLFRRVEPGPHPEVEIGQYLTERARFTRVPPLEGVIRYRRGNDESIDIGVLHALVANQGNAWTYTIDALSRYYEYMATHLRAASPPDSSLTQPIVRLVEEPIPESALNAIGAYSEVASLIGQRTAELHRALAEASDPAFSPEAVTPDELRLSADEMKSQAERVLGFLTSRLGTLSDETARIANEVLARKAEVIARLAALGEARVEATRIRCHNDYHLGQLLIAEQDIYVLDFEGEPARPLSYRRIKRSPLRDVAGMLRSFSYAAWAGLSAHVATRPADEEGLVRWASIWETWVSVVFLGSYLQHAAGLSFMPSDPEQLLTLLDAFLVDKSMYELEYELNNRPDWLGVPLHGILRLLTRPVR